MAPFQLKRKQQQARRRVVLILSDMHAGHSLGLFNPDTVLVRANDDGSQEDWTPESTPTQGWLWGLYQEHIEQAAAWADGAEIIIIHGGDATQGRRYGRLMKDVTLDDQRTIAVNNLIPLARLPNVKAIRLVTGTKTHVPLSAEARIAARLAEKTGADVASFHHHIADIDGVRFDVAHHGPYVGSRDWLKGNVAFYHLKDRVYTDRRLGREPARVYLYGHYHEFVRISFHEEWSGSRHSYDLAVCPSYCGLGDHGRKVTKSVPYLTVGMVGFEVIGGRLGEIRTFTQTQDLRTEEKL